MRTSVVVCMLTISGCGSAFRLLAPRQLLHRRAAASAAQASHSTGAASAALQAGRPGRHSRLLSGTKLAASVQADASSFKTAVPSGVGAAAGSTATAATKKVAARRSFVGIRANDFQVRDAASRRWTQVELQRLHVCKGVSKRHTHPACTLFACIPACSARPCILCAILFDTNLPTRWAFVYTIFAASSIHLIKRRRRR
jgi:hypothetical protein